MPRAWRSLALCTFLQVCARLKLIMRASPRPPLFPGERYLSMLAPGQCLSKFVRRVTSSAENAE
jgi:hypothetical protein